MKDKPLANVRVAILATNDFEQSEMTEPRQALMEAGAQTTLIAPESGKLQAMKHDMKADYFDVDLVLERANPADFDAVMLPGGALNADALRVDQKAQEFIRRIDEAGKPIAVICHGSWLLVSTGLTKGRTLTLSLIHISEPTRLGMSSYAVFCLKKKKKKKHKITYKINLNKKNTIKKKSKK